VISLSTRKCHDKTSYSAYRSSLFLLCELGCRAAHPGCNASATSASANLSDSSDYTDSSCADNCTEPCHAHSAGTGAERCTGSCEPHHDAANQPDRAAYADHD
jgi:hypothetical protein